MLALWAAVLGIGCERCACGSAEQAPSPSSGSAAQAPSSVGSPPGPNESTSGSGDESATLPEAIELTASFGSLRFQRPLWLTPVPTAEQTFVVLEQRGIGWLVRQRGEQWKRSRWLDLRDRVRREHNEEGLLGLAFHPDYPDPRQVFVYYSASNPRRTVLSRFSAPADLTKSVDPEGEKVLLEVEQPWGNHNGGCIVFGTDGYLYLGYGDGGAGGDPKNNGQDLGTLLGSIIRIDVDSTEGDKPYAIPEDNPFVDREGARPEIWAYGFRNPWRMSFDEKTGALWVGDVGQDKWEEVDVVRRGGNYGWNIREGSHPFEPRETDAELIDPVIDYGHDQGKSITGGHVYRGDAIGALRGAYVYADFTSGRIWALRYEKGEVVAHTELLHSELPLSSFGEREDGELYVTAFDGKVYRLAPADE
jgi:glucose/arabinose dehydrogenase